MFTAAILSIAVADPNNRTHIPQIVTPVAPMCAGSERSRRLSREADIAVPLCCDTDCMAPGPTTSDRDGTTSGRAGRWQWMSDRTRLVLGWVGIVLHSTFVALLYYLSLLVMPPWAAYILWGVWALLLFLAIHLLRRRSAWTLGVPFAAFGFWVAVGTLGDVLMGWTA